MNKEKIKNLIGNELTEEQERILNEKFGELSDEEISNISGGVIHDQGVTYIKTMECPICASRDIHYLWFKENSELINHIKNEHPGEVKKLDLLIKFIENDADWETLSFMFRLGFFN